MSIYSECGHGGLSYRTVYGNYSRGLFLDLQAKDQALELQIQQLDTEQNAIATEMDSVKKVIEDTMESVFKTFNG